MFLLFQSGLDWATPGKVTIAAAFFGILGLFIWKGVPWIRTQLEKKDELLLNEIAEARKERDEQRALRARELKEFMTALRRQDKTHREGFAKIAAAINNSKKR